MPKRATLPEANDILIGRKGASLPDAIRTVPQEQKPMVARKQKTKVRKSEKTLVEKSSTPEVLQEETSLVRKSESTKEEKIDKIIEMKSALSEELIQSSNWITELGDEELSDLLKWRTQLEKTLKSQL